MKKVLYITLLLLLVFTTAHSQPEKKIFEEGVRQFKQGQYTLAVEAFTELIKMAPENADAYKNRGVSYMKLEKFDQAIADFQKAKSIFPELKGLYSNLGVAWYYKKEYEKAIESYDMEIKLEPDHHVAYFNRALCLAELGRNKEALYDLAKTLGLKPDFYWAICYKGDILAQIGETEKAIETYEKAVAVSPEIAYAKDRLAKLRTTAKTGPQKTETKDEAPLKEETVSSVEKRQKKSEPSDSNDAYEIQIGAFLGKDNAERMQKQLQSKGFNSRVLVLEDAKARTWYLVRSGTFPDKETARQTIPLLNKEMGVKSVVRPFGDW